MGARIGTLLAYLLLLSGPILSDAQGCPATVSEGGIWPSDTPMEAREATNNLDLACCLFRWVTPLDFNLTEGYLYSPDTEFCTSAVTADEFLTAVENRRAVTVEGCSQDCDAWGPPLGAECCIANRFFTDLGVAEPVSEEVSSYHTVPWIPVDLCPASGSASTLLGYDLDAEPSLACPDGGVRKGTEQTLEFSTVLNEHFKDGTYVLAFHRKLQLSPMTVTFQVEDAEGSLVIPEQTLNFDDGGSTTRRRRLLKKGGGGSFGGSRSPSSWGGSKTPSSPSSSYSGSPSSGGSFFSKPTSTSSSSGLKSKSGSSYSSGTYSTSFSNGAYRYTNSKGYPVATSSDLSSRSVSRGTLLATTSGRGAYYWGGSPNYNFYYGAPASFGNSWYYGGYNSYGYGYGGPSYWRMSYPIFIWTRPYGCYGPYSCYYHHHRYYHDERIQETVATQEFRTVHLPCDMALDLVMESAFEPSAYKLPLTLTIKAVNATVNEAAGGCEEAAQDLALNETSTPDSPALYATFVKMEDIEVLNSAGFASSGASWIALQAVLAVTAYLLAIAGL